MSVSDHNNAAHLSDPSRGSGVNVFCAECSERSYLAVLVAELLYKNQMLSLRSPGRTGTPLKS